MSLEEVSENCARTGSSNELFECTECKKTFKYVSHFQRHVLTHSDSRPYECASCNKKFKRQDALSTHELTHSDKLPFLCSQDDCGERFASKAALRYHELRHNNQTEFICTKDNCNKKFLTLGQLKQHQRTKIHQTFTSTSLPQPLKIEQTRFPSSPSLEYQNSQVDSIVQTTSAPGLMRNLMDSIIESTHDISHRNEIIREDRKNIEPQIPHQKTAHYRLKNYHQQEKTFLDEYSDEEQAFIDQIWSTIKQENPSASPISQERQVQNFEDSCNAPHASHNYPIIKKRRISSNSSNNINNNNNNQSDSSNFLTDFQKVNSNSSSFGKLKQELRIIVGLIGKIKKEDEELQNPQLSLSTKDILAPSLDKQSSLIQQDNSLLSKKSVKSEEISSVIFFNPSNHRQGEQDYYFYQNDQNPFHEYQCKELHKYMPQSALEPMYGGELDKNMEKEPSQLAATLDSTELGDRPLLRKKIQTAVRLVYLCKKTCLEEKKKQQQLERQNSGSSSNSQVTRKRVMTSENPQPFLDSLSDTMKQNHMSMPVLENDIQNSQQLHRMMSSDSQKHCFSEAIDGQYLPPFYPNYVSQSQFPQRFQPHVAQNVILPQDYDSIQSHQQMNLFQFKEVNNLNQQYMQSEPTANVAYFDRCNHFQHGEQFQPQMNLQNLELPLSHMFPYDEAHLNAEQLFNQVGDLIDEQAGIFSDEYIQIHPFMFTEDPIYQIQHFKNDKQ